MCGIFCLADFAESNSTDSKIENAKIVSEAVELLYPRGPDSQSTFTFKAGCTNIGLGFTRLSIMDVSNNGMQPFSDQNGNTVICNGEIYNYQELISTYDLETRSNSDCEILLPLFKEFGFRKMLTELLDGEFAICLFSAENNRLFVGRDRFGVRPLYYGYNDETKSFAFGSELKALHSSMQFVEQLKPNTYIELDLEKSYNRSNMSFHIYYDYTKLSKDDYITDQSTIKSNINRLLTSAVKKRLHSDREIGFLLSGGLDSSLIVAIATRILGPEKITCFSIGIDGSPDVEAAKAVAKYLGITKHHIIPFDMESAIGRLPDVIRTIETYDITTIRASTPQYDMAKYIRENTDIRALLSGEGSDEIHGSYRYFRDAPSAKEFNDECIRLLEELYLFDNLRTDRTMAGNGLEVRVPFLDYEYVEYVFSIDPTLFMYRVDHMEKQIIRDSFEGYLPKEILYRSKEAFSDAVSSDKENWAEKIKTAADKIIPDKEFEIFGSADESIELINKPRTKDALLFRYIFDKIYPGRANVLPHIWLPKFQQTEVLDPSARVLNCY